MPNPGLNLQHLRKEGRKGKKEGRKPGKKEKGEGRKETTTKAPASEEVEGKRKGEKIGHFSPIWITKI